MIEQMLNSPFNIKTIRYNSDKLLFEIDGFLPDSIIPCSYQFHKANFPNHTPFKFLDEMVRVGDEVKVWLKTSELLKQQGWRDLTKNTMASPDSPFKIGRNKKPYLGGLHPGVIFIDEKFRPFVKIGPYRFSESEVKCIITEKLIETRSVELGTKNGMIKYDSKTHTITTPSGTIDSNMTSSFISLLRMAKLL